MRMLILINKNFDVKDLDYIKIRAWDLPLSKFENRHQSKVVTSIFLTESLKVLFVKVSGICQSSSPKLIQNHVQLTGV